MARFTAWSWRTARRSRKSGEIALDPASLTSVNLLRCLLAESGLSPRLISSANDSARLLIGDQAIRFREEHGDGFHYRDLGQWWKEMTGLPFVFALWLVRPEVGEGKAIAEQLRARRDANLAGLEQLIAAEENYSPDFLRFYFNDCLRFGFGPREQEGLLKFRQLCQRHALLPPGNDGPLPLV